jgi:hypothetical protein
MNLKLPNQKDAPHKPDTRPNGDIEKVTGRPATSFQEFARRSAPAWALPAAKWFSVDRLDDFSAPTKTS